MNRVAIIGVSASGKTTLSKKMSKKLNLTHKELDSFYWEYNWNEADSEIFIGRVTDFVKQDRWVTDGNFSQVRELVWGRATHVIWLDYSLLRILKQFFARSIRRSFSKEELWNGNTESLRNSIFKKDSLLFWILKTYRVYGKRYSTLIAAPEHKHIAFVRLKSPEETNTFLKQLGC